MASYSSPSGICHNPQSCFSVQYIGNSHILFDFTCFYLPALVLFFYVFFPLGAIDHITVTTKDGKFPLNQLGQISLKSPQLFIINLASFLEVIFRSYLKFAKPTRIGSLTCTCINKNIKAVWHVVWDAIADKSVRNIDFKTAILMGDGILIKEQLHLKSLGLM
uniref:Ribosome-recycling factor, mitochondrial n=1 Tax=Xenopus tropicalis TaxID=8364 RepID=A0A803KB62_XENTR